MQQYSFMASTTLNNRDNQMISRLPQNYDEAFVFTCKFIQKNLDYQFNSQLTYFSKMHHNIASLNSKVSLVDNFSS